MNNEIKVVIQPIPKRPCLYTLTLKTDSVEFCLKLFFRNNKRDTNKLFFASKTEKQRFIQTFRITKNAPDLLVTFSPTLNRLVENLRMLWQVSQQNVEVFERSETNRTLELLETHKDRLQLEKIDLDSKTQILSVARKYSSLRCVLVHKFAGTTPVEAYPLRILPNKPVLQQLYFFAYQIENELALYFTAFRDLVAEFAPSTQLSKMLFENCFVLESPYKEGIVKLRISLLVDVVKQNNKNLKTDELYFEFVFSCTDTEIAVLFQKETEKLKDLFDPESDIVSNTRSMAASFFEIKENHFLYSKKEIIKLLSEKNIGVVDCGICYKQLTGLLIENQILCPNKVCNKHFCKECFSEWVKLSPDREEVFGSIVTKCMYCGTNVLI